MKKHVKTALFDLDGTLLPMDQDAFISAYFSTLIGKLSPFGYDKKLIEVIWHGTADMIKNSGEVTNNTLFWKAFTAVYGDKARTDERLFDDYYSNDFTKVSSACGYSPSAAKVISLCKSSELRVALATNPIFPAVATNARIAWAGLKPTDFELVTTYENSHSCKPNLAYYTEICDKLNVAPDECVMIGNDVGEDMVARNLGMRVFLLTDCIINKNNEDISAYPHGSFDELYEFLREINN
ncbi:MAG: HAD family hydrolase [Clostridiales bacterium]|nr:HAD family hydrolase [Clostridiales bacterium]